MKKRFLAAIVCAALALSLAGCASDETNPEYEDEESKSSRRASRSVSSDAESAGSPAESEPEDSAPGTTSTTSKPNVNLADWEYSTYEDNGERVIRIYGYRGTDEKVEIPAEINGIKVAKIDGGTFAQNIDITNITIPESITSISSGAFYQCINLSEITFKGSTPTLGVNGDDALEIFNGTPWLEAKKAENPNFFIIGDTLIKGLECEGDITIPGGVKKIGKSAFWGNVKITSAVIPNGVTEIGVSAFGDCNKMVNVTIPDSVTKISNNAFQSCGSLVSVTIPDSVTEISDEMFYNCVSLQTINLHQNIVSIGDNAYARCEKLVGRFTLPDSIRELGDSAFGYNRNIELVYKGTVYKVSDNDYRELVAAIKQSAIDEEFGDKDFVITNNILMKIKPGVTKIELPDTVKGIDDKAFEGCDQSFIITFKGKNYNLKNLDKLKTDISAN